MKINHLVAGASVAAFGLVAVLLQTSNGFASVSSVSGPVMVAANACVVPDTSHPPATAAEKIQLRKKFFAADTDVSVSNPAMPDVPKSAMDKPRAAYALVKVGADGRPISATIATTSGNKAMDQATIKAAMDSTYTPALKNCKPVAGTYMFKVQSGS